MSLHPSETTEPISDPKLKRNIFEKANFTNQCPERLNIYEKRLELNFVFDPGPMGTDESFNFQLHFSQIDIQVIYRKSKLEIIVEITCIYALYLSHCFYIKLSSAEEVPSVIKDLIKAKEKKTHMCVDNKRCMSEL